MPSEKYTKGYLQKQLAPEIREHLRTDGLDPTRLPTYEYLEAKGFKTRGLTLAIKRHFNEDLTLHEFLSKQGFGHENGEWPTSHEETIRMLNGFKKSRIKRNDDRTSTVKTVKSALNWVLRHSDEVHGVDNLLKYARADDDMEKYRRSVEIEDILDEMKDELSDGATQNYVGYLEAFYDFSEVRTRVDFNPVSRVRDQYSFDTTPESEPQPLSDGQIRALWKTLKHLPKRSEYTAVDGLIDRHGLETWRIQMMVLLVFSIGVGPRTRDIERTNAQTDWKFDNGDPHIEFPVRKNLPDKVPVLAHPGFLEAYRDFCEIRRDNWNGKPFPSGSAQKGSRTGNTLNRWLSVLCEEADVRLSDGGYPTIQNIRQTWQNEYHAVLRRNEVQLKLVANEAGTKNESQVRTNYLTSEEERESIRALAQKDFESFLPLNELPKIMSETLTQREYINQQANLTDF